MGCGRKRKLDANHLRWFMSVDERKQGDIDCIAGVSFFSSFDLGLAAWEVVVGGGQVDW